ncbi:MucR family transcriptional regulator [Actinopolyspora halophila]|uniref:MucR family transcriptional regulator n=1 Tax=Actinopolyspora halophila TaxID=1850 RepID=UPI0012F92F11|nr:MucR family transcriptional regulator [Actinopolyspora halophila]
MSERRVWCRDCGERSPVARGRCLRCYKRARAGTDTVALSRYGQPDGYGWHGILTEDGQQVLCHDCGRWVSGLGMHARAAHGMSAADYRAAHGLPAGRGLISSEVSRQHSELARARVGTRAWERFTAARDPVAASQAREHAGVSASAALRQRSDIAASNGRAGRRAAVRSCPVCAAQWCPLPGGYGRRTCGSSACRRARAAERARAQREAAPQLTPQQHNTLATLRGDELRAEVLRLKHQVGISQRAMATAIGTSPNSLSRLVRGDIPVSLR